jgi:hypothetical protein
MPRQCVTVRARSWLPHQPDPAGAGKYVRRMALHGRPSNFGATLRASSRGAVNQALKLRMRL